MVSVEKRRLYAIMETLGSEFDAAAPVGLKAPFAYDGSGTIVHVSRIQGRDQGPFTCPGCGGGLTYRRASRRARGHLAHNSDSPCAGESALHLYAKDVLTRSGRIDIPGLVLRSHGQSETVCKPSPDFRFDDVHTEVVLPGFTPDAMGHVRTERLAIEFRVTHEVDDEKRARVRAADLSMIEIDLRIPVNRMFDVDSLDRFILKDAPRQWIHHRRSAAARERLDAKVAMALQQERKKFGVYLARKIKPSDARKRTHASNMRDLSEAGLVHLVGVPVKHAHWFTLRDEIWQAHLLVHEIYRRVRSFTPTETPLEVIFQDVRLPEDMRRSDLRTRGSWGSHLTSDQDLGSEGDGIWSYFLTLHEAGIVGWNKSSRNFFLTPSFHRRHHWVRQINTGLSRLLADAGVEGAEAVLTDWWVSWRYKGRSPYELVTDAHPETQGLIALIDVLCRRRWVEAPQVPEETIGLPLQAMVDKEEDRRHQEERLKREREEAADLVKRRERLGILRYYAQEARLEHWMDVPVSGVKPADLAWESDAGLGQARDLLRDELRAIAMRKAKEEREQTIRTLVERAFRDDTRRQLFLRGTHPALGGRRPIEMIESDAEIAAVRKLLDTF